MRSRFVAQVAAVAGGILARRMSANRMPISRGIAPLADIPDGERRDGGPELVFLDIGLAQAMLGFDGAAWILDPEHAFVNAGELAESFVGQELLAYATPHVSPALYYWHREAAASNAEVDYCVAAGHRIVPVEVKSGASGALKSLRLFLDTHRKLSPEGVRFSTYNYSTVDALTSYPLYAVGSFMAGIDPDVREAMLSLM